jgi:anthranilate phosphoribosyltransferase
VVGVFAAEWVEPLAETLARLGSEHVLVVHAADGLDEISIETPTQVAELDGGKIRRMTLTPEQFGLKRGRVRDIVVTDPNESLSLIESALNNEEGTARDIVALNAGAAIYAAGLAPTIETGVQRALETIAMGRAREKLRALAGLSRKLAGQ